MPRLGGLLGPRGATFSTAVSGNARMWGVSTAAQECWGPPPPQRAPGTKVSAGHVAGGTRRQWGWGHRGQAAQSAVCHGKAQDSPQPRLRVPRGPQPSTAGHSATIPTHSAHSLPPKPALHGNTAAEGRSRHDAHLSRPGAASPGPQPRPRIRPKNDRCCQPPTWSQAGASPRGTPPPHPGAGLGN